MVAVTVVSLMIKSESVCTYANTQQTGAPPAVSSAARLRVTSLTVESGDSPLTCNTTLEINS